MEQKIAKHLLIALILSLGFGQLLRFEVYTLPVYLHDILAVLLILTLFYKERFFVIPKYLYLFGLSLILSSSYALLIYPLTQLLVPSLYLLRLLAYTVLYLLLKQAKISIDLKYIQIAGFTSLIIGLIQYIFMPDMRIFQYLGWDDHYFRLTLPHFDPTFTGVMLALMGLAIPRYIGAYLIAILFTYSRSVWLSLTATAVLTIKNTKLLFTYGFVVLLLALSLPRTFGEGTNLARLFSIQSRLQTDFKYLDTYRNDLVLGRGLNTLVLEIDDSKHPNHATGPNNSYIYLLLTTGVLGLIGWVTFMKNLYLQSRHKPMLIFFFVASLFNNVMFYPFALLWVLLIESMVPSEV